MNPINDELTTKDSTAIEKLPIFEKSSELSNTSSENSEKIKLKDDVAVTENSVKMNRQKSEEKLNEVINQKTEQTAEKIVNIIENELKPTNENEIIDAITEKNSEFKVNGNENMGKINEPEVVLRNNGEEKKNEEIDEKAHNTKKNANIILEAASEEATKKFKDVEDSNVNENVGKINEPEVVLRNDGEEKKNEENDEKTHNTNKNANIILEAASEEATEKLEDVEDSNVSENMGKINEPEVVLRNDSEEKKNEEIDEKTHDTNKNANIILEVASKEATEIFEDVEDSNGNENMTEINEPDALRNDDEENKNEKIYEKTHDTNKNANIILEAASKEATEELEDVEEANVNENMDKTNEPDVLWKNGGEENKNEEIDEKAHDINKNANNFLEAASEEETEEFEDDEDIEDVEGPGEDEVDEIIVPDEAEAEDLTDDVSNDNYIISKSPQEEEEEEEVVDDINNDNYIMSKSEEDEEEEMVDKESEGTSLHEEETTKSSEAAEKDEEDSENKSLNNDVQDDDCTKDYEEEEIENLAIEPELEVIEEDIRNTESALEETKSNEAHIDEDTISQAVYDPLNCTDDKEQDKEDTEICKITENENSLGNKTVENEDNVANNDVDDDEVQFVETRDSPICIESDEEDDLKDATKTSVCSDNTRNENDKRTITTATTTVTVPKNIIVTRTSARKSTAKPQQKQIPGKNSSTTVPHVHNRSKNFSYIQKAISYKQSRPATTSTQRIVECIELLDSSDEESARSRNRPSQQQQKTPQKRTLLAAKGNYYKNNNSKTTNSGNNRLPNNFSPQVRQQPKKPAPPPLPPATPQSNFLNAVQLQPASVSGANPPAFSALLSNKSVIIPNAFYGNPPNIRGSPETDIERRYVRWLESFLNQFCKSQFVATHSCFVFLQRALKYKDFVRIKTLRTNMNSHALTSANQINNQLMTDLRTIFFKSGKKITNYGRRFCELTGTAVPGKAVALIAHGISGKVTLKTCNLDVTTSTNATVSSASTTSQPTTTSITRKRQLDEDEEEYTPDKSKLKTKAKPPSENGDDDSCETGDDRKRSLRTKRTKRIDNSFSYNEDDLLAEYEIDDEDDEKLAQVEMQRKIEQKRLEAQKQRQQQAKSFENAFIQAFAKSLDGPTTSTNSTSNVGKRRIRLKNATTSTATSIRQYTSKNDAEDLLQATWIASLENDDAHVISDDDEPIEHHIYKQQQQDYHSTTTKLPTKNNTNTSARIGGRSSKKTREEIITGDDDYDENNHYANNPINVYPHYWPKNVDPQMYVNGKHKDRCIICDLSCQRLVHHYVNEHRGCEVYNSRLSSSQLRLLKLGKCTASNVSLYKNGQFQYEAFCIFCQKRSRFMLPYWYQHFTMHTGEYTYRCTGCGIRKPTRSLLTQHHAQGCPKVGGVALDYAHESKSMQIEARICTLCNYVQLHRINIVNHLHQQHNIKQILPKHIQTIVLMKTPVTLTNSPSSPSTSSGATHAKRTSSRLSSSYAPNTYVIDDDNDEFTYEEITPDDSQYQTNSENNYYNYIPPYMQAAVNSGNFSFENVDAGDDLSFMICGMLDVQMNSDGN